MHRERAGNSLASLYGQTPAGANAGVKPPEVIQRKDAAYPPEALRAGQQGTVTLLVTVGVDGKVTDATRIEDDVAAIAATSERLCDRAPRPARVDPPSPDAWLGQRRHHEATRCTWSCCLFTDCAHRPERV